MTDTDEDLGGSLIRDRLGAIESIRHPVVDLNIGRSPMEISPDSPSVIGVLSGQRSGI